MRPWSLIVISGLVALVVAAILVLVLGEPSQSPPLRVM